MKVLKKISLGLLISLISIVLCSIFLELFVRKFFPQELVYLRATEVWVKDDILGWKHKINASTPVNAVGERMIHFKTDENGFRVGDTKIKSPVYKILALGDSFTEGLLVEHEETFTGRLELILSEGLGLNTRVVNAGVGGWSPNQYLLQAKDELDREEYDLVLVFVYIGNDLVKIRQDKFTPKQIGDKHDLRLPSNFSKAELVNAIIYPINDFLETRSAVFMLFKKRSSALMMKLGITTNYFPNVFLKSEAKSPSYRVTAEICSDIEKVASEHGIETLFVLIPTSQQVQEESFKEFTTGFNIDPSLVDVTQPNRLLRENLENLGLSVFDSLPEMKEEYNKRKIRFYGARTDHFNSEGHKVFANILVPVLGEILESKQVNN